MSDVPSSFVSTVELTEDVKLRLLDNPNSDMLYTQKPEKCHLKSQTHYPEDKSNINNILYMSRYLHNAFDGINQYEGVPDFALRFQSYHPSAIRCPVGGGRQMELYEVTVRVVFPSEEQRQVYYNSRIKCPPNVLREKLFFNLAANIKYYLDMKISLI